MKVANERIQKIEQTFKTPLVVETLVFAALGEVATVQLVGIVADVAQHNRIRRMAAAPFQHPAPRRQVLQIPANHADLVQRQIALGMRLEIRIVPMVPQVVGHEAHDESVARVDALILR